MRRDAGSAPTEHLVREQAPGLERVVLFSDAVFAIAITLLALEMRVPDGLSSEALAEALVDLWPRYLSYLISFGVIGGFWRAHHQMFRYMQATDGRLLYMNLIFLMCIAFLPFPVALFGGYAGERLAVAVYTGSVTATGTCLAAVWWYAARHRRLIAADLEPSVIRQITTERITAPALALFVLLITLLFGVAVAAMSLPLLVVIQNIIERLVPRLLPARFWI